MTDTWTRRSDLLEFDSHDPEVLTNPYAVYARLREAGPLARGGRGQWIVTQHADVTKLLGDQRLSAEYPEEYHRLSVGDGPAVDFFTRIMLDRDGASHLAMRRLMHKSITPRTVRELRPVVLALVEDLLAAPTERGDLEVVRELALPVPITVVCELLGIPESDRSWLRPHALDLARGFGLEVTPDDRRACHQAVAVLREYVDAQMRERRRIGSTASDLLTVFALDDDARSSFERQDLVDNLVFLFFAGFETTSNLIANGVHALVERPDEWRRLREAPGLRESAVEELLRYDAPIQAAARLITEPMEMAGRTLRPGRLLVLLLGSANRDPAAYVQPDRLDISRAPNPHVSFGGGRHLCLGAALARMEGACVLEVLGRRVREMALDGAAERRHSTSFRSWARLPVSLTVEE